MASSIDYVTFVCDQIRSLGDIRYRKMFGEYMVYINDKPLLLICDDTTYIKIKEATTAILSGTPTGTPYQGAKEHYVLDPDDDVLLEKALRALYDVTPLPKPKKKKTQKEGK